MADKGGRVPELDAIRGLAAVLVVVAHYVGEVPHGTGALAFGWAGVDMFFVLSGFLVGGILMDNRGAANLLPAFYARRMLRIAPAYFAVLCAVFLAMASAGERAWIDPPLPAAWYFTWTQNIAMARLGATGGPWLLPTWTLAIEQQFYLLFPLVVLAVPPRRLAAACLAGIAASFAVRGLILLAGLAHPFAAQALLPSRADLLLLGVLAAGLWRAPGARAWLSGASGQTWAKAACASGLWLFCAAFWLDGHLGAATSVVLLVGHTLFGFACAAFVLLAVNGAAGRWLRLRPLRFMGSISYGLYLVHQPVAGCLHGLVLGGRPDISDAPQVAVTLAALGLSIAIAWASWRWFEAPLLRFGRRWRYGRPEGGQPVAATA